MLHDVSFSEAQRILGVPPHILRYWMKKLPVISSGRGDAGRILFSMRDLQILIRAKHLIVDQKMSVKKATAALLDELAGEKSPAAIGALNGMKSDLLEAMIKKMRETDVV